MKYVSKQDNEMMISNVVIFVVVAIAVVLTFFAHTSLLKNWASQIRMFFKAVARTLCECELE